MEECRLMTGQERILAALSGEMPDRVPFVPNIWQWFYVNQYNGTLPAAFEGMSDPVQALKAMGADIFSKFDGGVGQPEVHACQHDTRFEGEFPEDKVPWTSFVSFDGGPIRKDSISTPFGTLTHTWEYRRETGAPFESEHWWEDFSAEYAAVRHWMMNTDWKPDLAALQSGMERMGEDGTVIFQLLPSPLKQFHWLAGQVGASLFILDHPAEMLELAAIHELKFLEYLEQVVDLEGVWVYEVADNLDSLFYSPELFRRFCLPVLRKAAGIIHARGKYLFVHACGHLKHLAPLLLEAEIDCVEGQAPPPIGDWPLHEARALSERLVICGGMAAPEQELMGAGAAQQIRGYVRSLFESMGGMRRFLFGSSCNTSPRTPLENLLAFRDAAWEYGRLGPRQGKASPVHEAGTRTGL
jgi:hypothetical protein